ncbi:MAG: protein kinase [Krumholzibacteria bacterium]|nr:protein kinase [Candidatus Krumholzibacteria bacterium]
MQPGRRIAQYEIKDRIGAGGMGEVFAARDTNLDRDVAVKVLPGELADNPSRLARLEREAKAIAALSHPNILAVYDFGTDADGTAYVVTELLTGETLRERLAGSPLPVRKATDYGRQIARGLAAAHDRGIVHRDLKPENLFLTHEGRVKILDFGLATAAAARSDSPSDIGATIDLDSGTKLTAPGAVLGTVDYMSPEQVRGQPTDARADIFSFGTVLYELVSGRKPFQRETGAETMTAILREDPADLATSGRDLPPALVAIIRRCLEKRPGERFHSAHDLAFSLEALSGSTVASGSAIASGPGSAQTGVGGPRRRYGAATLLGLVLAGLVVGAAAAWFLRPAPPAGTDAQYMRISSRRGTVTNARFAGGEGVAIYSAAWADEPLNLFRGSGDSRSSPTLGLPGCDLLSVSPSGELAVALDRRQTLGWEAYGTLAVAQPGGAAPRPVLENVGVADWSPDGQNLAVAHQVDGVVRLEYPIGTVLYEAPGWISALRVNPDGERILFADNPLRGDNICRAKIIHRDGRIEDLGFGGVWGLLWDRDGEAVIASGGQRVFRLRPGRERELLTAAPVSLKLLDLDPSGRMLVAAAAVRRELIGRAPGAAEETNLSWQDWSTPATISGDGRWVLFEEGNDVTVEGYAIYLRRMDGSAPVNLGYGSVVALAPDHTRVAIVKRPTRDDQTLVLVPTGVGEPQAVGLGGLRVANQGGQWLRDAAGQDAIIVPASRAGEGLRIYRIPLDGVSAPTAITPEGYALAAYGHVVSRDGRRLVVVPSTGAAVAFTGDGEGPQAVPGVLPTDLPLGLDSDGRHLFVQVARTLPSPILRIDLESGERTLLAALSPRDPGGVSVVDRVRISDDGDAYVYSIRRVVSELNLVEGLR